MIRFLKSIVKFLGIIIIASIAVSFISPFYSFPESKSFSGEKIYNPYENMNNANWILANFQVQSDAWGGVTNGRKNSDSLIFEKYKTLGFDLVSISDYQKINQYNSYDESYVPVYEHGYGVFKNHQVCLGSGGVDWLDFPIYHTLHHKQFILNRLKQKNELVAIAHPKLWGAYNISDMTKLTNYDLIEVLNNYRISESHWDAALSSGKPVFLLANDDAHNVHNIKEVGRRFTVINTSDMKKENILLNLRYGVSYGVDLENSDSVWDEKAHKINSIPQLLSVTVENDTILYKFNAIASKFEFIGQNGDMLKVDSLKTQSFYKMKKNDTYVRLKVYFDSHATFYLNPVFRYSGEKPIQHASAHIDIYKTNIFRFTLLTLLIFIFGFRFYYNRLSRIRGRKWLPQPI